MASPALQPMCCWFVENVSDEVHNDSNTVIDDWETVVKTYDSLCIIASLLSIAGAIYQLFPRRPRNMPRTEKEMDSFIMQNRIVCWLAFADFLASLGDPYPALPGEQWASYYEKYGDKCPRHIDTVPYVGYILLLSCSEYGILIRSCVWIGGYLPWLPEEYGEMEMDFDHIFCAVSTAWIQFFYICTYFWTLSYAIHMYRAAHDLSSRMLVYHILGWVVPAILSTIGLVALYGSTPTSCSHSLWNLLPSYLASYIPITMVMIVNPILYFMVSNTVQQSLRGRGLYTDLERAAVSNLRTRFFSVMIVFYICWSPNILNSMLLLWLGDIGTGVYVALWHFMAIVNPLQAFLNSLVYHNVGGCNIRWTQSPFSQNRLFTWRYRKRQPDIQHTSHTDMEESTEVSPLLHYRS